MNHLVYLGIGVCIAVSCVALIEVASRFIEWRTNVAWKKDYERKTATAKEVGRSLVQLAHWYGEDRSVYEAVRTIGQEIMESGSVGTFDVSKCRDEWRKATGRKAS